MKILIYGSTYLTQKVVYHLKDKFDLVGYIPSVNPTFKGDIPLPIVAEDTPHDIKLSIQYDQKIDGGYNLHTGLLPMYGGCNILYHTIKNKDKWQGLTFHKIADEFDAGETLYQVKYPVLETDRVVDLYQKMCNIAPQFVEMCLANLLGQGHAMKPVIYKRSVGDINDINEIKTYVTS